MEIAVPHVDINVEELAVGLIAYNDYESLVALVVALERHVGDSVFSELLEAAMTELRNP